MLPGETGDTGKIEISMHIDQAPSVAQIQALEDGGVGESDAGQAAGAELFDCPALNIVIFIVGSRGMFAPLGSYPLSLVARPPSLGP